MSVVALVFSELLEWAVDYWVNARYGLRWMMMKVVGEEGATEIEAFVKQKDCQIRTKVEGELSYETRMWAW
jgi:hypothetical protein